MKYPKILPLPEFILYYGFVIASLGITWVIKVIIKKAILEALQDSKK